MRNFTPIFSKLTQRFAILHFTASFIKTKVCATEWDTGKSKNKGKIIVINFRCWTVILGVSTISSCMTTACSFWIWSVAQSLILKRKSSAERVKGRALVFWSIVQIFDLGNNAHMQGSKALLWLSLEPSGVRGNRNPRVLGTFAPKVPPTRTAEKNIL